MTTMTARPTGLAKDIEQVKSNYAVSSDATPASQNQGLSSSGSQRFARGFAPLHSGFGFGADAIRERSLGAARASQQKKQTKLQEILQAPMPHLEKRKSERYSSMPHQSESSQARTQFSFESATQSLLSASHEKTQLPLDVEFVPSQEDEPSRLQSLQITRVEQREEQVQAEEVTIVSALVAWALDLCVGGCILLLSGIASYGFLPESFTGFLGKAISQYDLPVNVANHLELVTHLGQIFVLTITVLALIQTLSCVFLEATLGRYAMGIRVKHSNKSIFSVLAMGLGEVLTFAGLLTLPFVLILPRRAPFAPWIKLESSNS